MTRKKSNPSVFNAGTAINVFSIPILTGVVLFIGWYFTTNVTLTQYGKDIASLQSSREKDKNEFASKFDQMNGSLNTLNTHAAVQDETLKAINDRLGAFLQRAK